jgi:hypothetical protein
VFDPSVDQIIATGVSIAFTTVIGTACRVWFGQVAHKWKLGEMDKQVQNLLILERERRRRRPQRQLDRPKPP